MKTCAYCGHKDEETVNKCGIDENPHCCACHSEMEDKAKQIINHPRARK